MIEASNVIDVVDGPAPSRHVDPITQNLSAYSKAFEDAQKVRIAATLRGDEWSADLFHDVEHQVGSRLQKELKRHPLWPWLSQFNGLKGPRVARLISIIGDPTRFPGQKCSMGHTLPPVFEVGQRCPVTAESRNETEFLVDGDNLSPDADRPSESGSRFGVGGPFVTADMRPESEKAIDGDDFSPDVVHLEIGQSAVRGTFPTVADEKHRASHSPVVCVGRMLPPRSGTGVASLWHYMGLHVRDGKLPMRRKGQQADWHITARSLILGPQGVASQIVMQRPLKYRNLYDSTKARIAERSPEWRPIQVEKVARIIAAKAFLGDLLVEWKRVVGEADQVAVTERPDDLSDVLQEKAS